jgi:hypothetical protein
MIATILQAAGATVISVGFGLIFAPAGIIIAGVFAILFGLSLERR